MLAGSALGADLFADPAPIHTELGKAAARRYRALATHMRQLRLSTAHRESVVFWPF